MSVNNLVFSEMVRMFQELLLQRGVDKKIEFLLGVLGWNLCGGTFELNK